MLLSDTFQTFSSLNFFTFHLYLTTTLSSAYIVTTFTQFPRCCDLKGKFMVLVPITLTTFIFFIFKKKKKAGITHKLSVLKSHMPYSVNAVTLLLYPPGQEVCEMHAN